MNTVTEIEREQEKCFIDYEERLKMCKTLSALGECKRVIKQAYLEKRINSLHLIRLNRRIESRYTEVVMLPFTTSV
jgi:hypothetical protein